MTVIMAFVAWIACLNARYVWVGGKVGGRADGFGGLWLVCALALVFTVRAIL